MASWENTAFSGIHREPGGNPQFPDRPQPDTRVPSGERTIGQPGPFCVGCADIKLSRIGPTALARKHGRVSVAVAKEAVTLSPASPSSVIFSSEWTYGSRPSITRLKRGLRWRKRASHHRQQDHVQRHRRSRLPVSCDERHRSSDQDLPHAKKAGTLPVENSEEVKRTNKIKMAIPLRDAIDIQGTDVSADALLTQRQLAEYLVTERKAPYHFTVKGNQPGVLQDLELYLQDRGQPHFVEHTPRDHGRIESRKIWTTTELNSYLDFLHVGQTFVIERYSVEKKPAKALWILPMALPVELPDRPIRNACSRSTGSTGLLRTAATTFLIGTITKIAIEYAKVTVRKTSPSFAASPLD